MAKTETELPLVSRYVQHSLDMQERNRTSAEQYRQKEKARLQTYMDEYELFKNSKLLEIMKKAGMMLKKSSIGDVRLLLTDPYWAVCRESCPIELKLVWNYQRSHSWEGKASWEDMIVTTKKDEDKIVGFRFNPPRHLLPNKTQDNIFWTETGFDEESLIGAVDMGIADPNCRREDDAFGVTCGQKGIRIPRQVGRFII